jgi:hypothetical protein
MPWRGLGIRRQKPPQPEYALPEAGQRPAALGRAAPHGGQTCRRSRPSVGFLTFVPHAYRKLNDQLFGRYSLTSDYSYLNDLPSTSTMTVGDRSDHEVNHLPYMCVLCRVCMGRPGFPE